MVFLNSGILKYWAEVITFSIFLGFAANTACSSKPLQCKNVKVAYWQDQNAKQYKYKISYLCELPDGTTETVTPLASETRIPY